MPCSQPALAALLLPLGLGGLVPGRWPEQPLAGIDEVSLLQTSLWDSGPGDGDDAEEPSDARKAAKHQAVTSDKNVTVHIPGLVDPTNASQAIQLIGAGMGRSGTASYMCALKKLGYNPAPGTLLLEEEINFTLTHGVMNVTASNIESNVLYQDAWMEWASGGTYEPCYEQLTSLGYNATIGEIPASFSYSELLDRNPDAKVVLLLHPGGAEAWAASLLDPPFSDTLDQTEPWGGCFPDERVEFMSHFLKCCDFSQNFTDIERLDTCILEYKEEVRKVEEAVPPEQLLKYSVDKGWEPLCDFLGLEVPAEPFPKEAPDVEGCNIERVHWEWQVA